MNRRDQSIHGDSLRRKAVCAELHGPPHERGIRSPRKHDHATVWRVPQNRDQQLNRIDTVGEIDIEQHDIGLDPSRGVGCVRQRIRTVHREKSSFEIQPAFERVDEKEIVIDAQYREPLRERLTRLISDETTHSDRHAQTGSSASRLLSGRYC